MGQLTPMKVRKEATNRHQPRYENDDQSVDETVTYLVLGVCDGDGRKGRVPS